MTYFDYLELFFGKKQKLFNVCQVKLKNSLRGGGCCNSNSQHKPSNPNSQNKPVNIQQILEKLQVLKELNPQFNSFLQFRSVLENCDDDCVILSYQTITIFLEILQQLKFPYKNQEQTFKIFNDTIDNLKGMLSGKIKMNQDEGKQEYKEWLKMIEIYFKWLQQAQKDLEQFNNNGKHQSNLMLMMKCNFQNEWNEIKNLTSKLDQYETFYFYLMFQNKLVQSNENNDEILENFFKDVVNNQNQEIQKANYRILIAAQLNLMNRLVSKSNQEQQLENLFNKVLKIKYKDNETFTNFILKQLDVEYLEIQKWLALHLIILEQIQKNNTKIIEYVGESFTNFKMYQDQNFLLYWNKMKGMVQQKKQNESKENVKQEVYQEQLKIYLKKIKKEIQQQQEDLTYVSPEFNIKQVKETVFSEILRKWLEQQNEDIFWLSGKVKSGKTILTKKIIENLCENSNWIPIYIDLIEIEKMGKPKEFLKILKQELFFTEKQIQQFFNNVNDGRENLVIVFDCFDQMSLSFKDKNIIKMLGYEKTQNNLKFIIVSREQMQNLQAYQCYNERMIQIEIQEFNEIKQKEYIELSMAKEIQRNNNNINISSITQMISININDGQILLQHQNEIKFQPNLQDQQFKQNLKKWLLNIEQLNFLMKNTFVDCFSFQYQFKLLINLISSINNKSLDKQQQISQINNKSKKYISNFEGLRSKNFEARINSRDPSEINSSSSEKMYENYELIDIDINSILELITRIDQDQRLIKGNMLIKCIQNFQLTKYEYINFLFEQYYKDSFNERECDYSKLGINQEKVLKHQIDLAFQMQKANNLRRQLEKNNQESDYDKYIKSLCLLKSIGENETFIDKIFKDYFIAKALYIEINEFEKDAEMLPNHFNKINVGQKDYSGAVALLQDVLLKKSNIKKIFINLIKLSINKDFQRSSSNSMYLLSILKLNLEEEKLDGIHISDINIQGLSFFKASLCKSHWENVDMSNCNFNLANLTDATLNNITGIEEPQINTEDVITQLQFKEQSQIIGILKSESISIWNINENKEIFNTKKSQTIKDMFHSYNYFSFQRETSIFAVLVEQNQNDTSKSEIWIIDYNEAKRKYELNNVQNCISLCFYKSKKLLCSYSNCKINVWDYEKKTLKEIQNEFGIITKMATNDNDTRIVLLDNNNKIRFCDLKKNQDNLQYKLLEITASSCKQLKGNTFTLSDCHKFVAIHYQNEVKIYDWELKETKQFQMQSSADEINSICLSKDWNRIAQYNNNKITFSTIKFKQNLKDNIFDSKIENAQYSPDGLNIVIQLENKTIFYIVNNDTIFIEIKEKVKLLVFSEKFFATSSDQGIKIYSFPTCELINWLPFKANQLIFSQQSQNLAIISDYIYIYNLKKIKISYQEFLVDKESNFIISISTDNKYMTIAQNGIIFFYQDKKYQNQLSKQEETILYICFTNVNNYLTMRSKIKNQHIFRIINFMTQESTCEWTEDNQTEDQDFSNQFQSLQIHNKVYVISNQNNQLFLQDVTKSCENNIEKNENLKKGQTFILELGDQETQILLGQKNINF